MLLQLHKTPLAALLRRLILSPPESSRFRKASGTSSWAFPARRRGTVPRNAREALLDCLDEMEDRYIAIERLEHPAQRWTLEARRESTATALAPSPLGGCPPNGTARSC